MAETDQVVKEAECQGRFCNAIEHSHNKVLAQMSPRELEDLRRRE